MERSLIPVSDVQSRLKNFFLSASHSSMAWACTKGPLRLKPCGADLQQVASWRHGRLCLSFDPTSVSQGLRSVHRASGEREVTSTCCGYLLNASYFVTSLLFPFVFGKPSLPCRLTKRPLVLRPRRSFPELLLNATCCRSFISFCFLMLRWVRWDNGMGICRGGGIFWNATWNRPAPAPIPSPSNGLPTNSFPMLRHLRPPRLAIMKTLATPTRGA